MNSPLPRCPKCNSPYVHLLLRPAVRHERDGQWSTTVNGTFMHCTSCLHTWERKAVRKGQMVEVPNSKPGFWARLFHRIAPHLF